MVRYQRPRFPDIEFRDASGSIIEYGRRWQGGSPPDDTYSVATHPERFAPLHTVAEALVVYLLRRYDASSREDPAVAADLMVSRDDVVRAVRITPANTDAAPLTVVFTSCPSLLVHAGLLHDFPFPGCGCDACDETAEALADELEETVIAVAEGRYQETFDAGVSGRRPPGRWSALLPSLAADAPPAAVAPDSGARAGFAIVAADGSRRRSGRTMLDDRHRADRLATAKLRLEGLPDGWQPWSLRSV